MIPFQVIVNAIIGGAGTALVAVGFSLIYSTNRFAHFAHGAVIAVGGYATWYFFESIGLPFFLAACIGILFSIIIGISTFFFVYEPLIRRGASRVILLIASLGLLILLNNTIQLVFGADVHVIHVLPVTVGMELWGAYITPIQCITVAVTLLLLVVLGGWLKFSHHGRIVRAVADNMELAELNGIPARRIRYLTFAIGSAVAGIAGILIGLERNLEPTMGVNQIVFGFTAAVIGGVQSIAGAILGGFLIGLIDNVGVWYFSSGIRDAIIFGGLMLFLLLRPQGIFGIKKNTRT